MQSSVPTPVQSRLTRPADMRRVGGVCSGLAQYVGVDPIIPRLIFVGLLFSGLGLVLYPVLWMIIPAEGQTPSTWKLSAGFAEMRTWLRQSTQQLRQEIRSRRQARMSAASAQPSSSSHPRFDPQTGQPLDPNEIPINNMPLSAPTQAVQIRRRRTMGVIVLGLGLLLLTPLIGQLAHFTLPLVIIVAGVLLLRRPAVANS